MVLASEQVDAPDGHPTQVLVDDKAYPALQPEAAVSELHPEAFASHKTHEFAPLLYPFAVQPLLHPLVELAQAVQTLFTATYPVAHEGTGAEQVAEPT